MDSNRHARLMVDTLTVPYSSDATSRSSSLTSESASDLIRRTTSNHMIARTRSNSIKSFNSSDIKTSYIFKRADSFRHKIKSESLCPQQSWQLSEQHTAAAAVCDEPSTTDMLTSNPISNITIQIDEVN